MRISQLLEIASAAMPGRVVVTDDRGPMSVDELFGSAQVLGAWVAENRVDQLVFVGQNSRALPISLYAASIAGVPFTPLNYRFPDERLRALAERTAPSIVVADDGMLDRLATVPDVRVVAAGDIDALVAAPTTDSRPAGAEPDETAVLLFTSGTTGDPKAAVLRHENLASYVLSTVDLASASEDEAALVSVPPYHIAAVSAALSSVFSGRRTVYLPAFDPQAWVRTAVTEHITHAMVVPTMLQQILAVLDESDERLPDLRALSYGGGPMPLSVIERALDRWPHVDFVNAYGLTETASTITLLGPDEHRVAHASSDPAVRHHLSSVGRPLPTVDLSIRDPFGNELGAGERGEVWVRGEQVSGRYLGIADEGDGWFRTRDAAELDADGFLYLHGRLDDVIVRGAENLSPGEIENVLLEHPDVDGCAVVGVPDTQWGEIVVAAVVRRPGGTVTEAELQAHVRGRLRSTQTPVGVDFRAELPMNETGKLLRRVLRTELAACFGST